MACVGNDDDLREVCTGPNGAFAGMSSGSLFVDHTTVSASVTRDLAAQAANRGIGYVDAPVSGGQAGAENGALSVMCGGSEADYLRAEPVIDAYAKACKRIGVCGAGQLAKMVNQICIAGLLQGLAEALHFAEKNDLDSKAVIDVIQHGAAGILANVESPRNHVEGRVRVRIRSRLDAQGSRNLFENRRRVRREPSSDGIGRPVLTRRSRKSAALVGIPPALSKDSGG